MRTCIVPIPASIPGVPRSEIGFLAKETFRTILSATGGPDFCTLVLADGTPGRQAATWLGQACGLRVAKNKLDGSRGVKWIHGPWRTEPALIAAAARLTRSDDVLVVRVGAAVDRVPVGLWQALANGAQLAYGRLHASHPVYGERDYGRPVAEEEELVAHDAALGANRLLYCPVPPVFALKNALAQSLETAYHGFYPYELLIRLLRNNVRPVFVEDEVTSARVIFPHHGCPWSEAEDIAVMQKYNVFTPVEERACALS